MEKRSPPRRWTEAPAGAPLCRGPSGISGCHPSLDSCPRVFPPDRPTPPRLRRTRANASGPGGRKSVTTFSAGGARRTARNVSSRRGILCAVRARSGKPLFLGDGVRQRDRAAPANPPVLHTTLLQTKHAGRNRGGFAPGAPPPSQSHRGTGDSLFFFVAPPFHEHHRHS